MKFTNFFSFAILFTSILFTSFIYYKSEIIFNGARIDYYQIYYYSGVCLIIFSILSFYFNKSVKINITIIIFSSLFSVYIFQSILMLNFFKDDIQDARYKIAQKNNISFDNRSISEVYNDLKNIDEDITISVAPTNFLNFKNDFLPLGGVANKKTIHCNESGYYSIYKSDRFGFNNPNDEWNKKELEYLLIGDSFVHGSCVNERDTISGNLRTFNKQRGVINLGYRGNGSLIEYATLKEFGKKIPVRNILWFYYGNDIKDLAGELDNEILKKYLEDKSFNQNLEKKSSEIDNYLAKIIDAKLLSKNNYIYNFIKLGPLRSYIYGLVNNNATINEIDYDVVFKKFEHILHQANNFAVENNSEFYFIYLPMIHRYNSNDANDDDVIYYDKIINIVKNLGISIIDINEELFLKSENPMTLFPFGVHGHYTAEAYKDIASIIINRTKK
tara:strand:+ start:806 stop:2137 length:1332 start_codon:yes stop_codon:yes gene_type:complete